MREEHAMQRLAVVTFALAAVAACAVIPARATFRGSNGLLVYQAQVGEHTQLFTIRPDGSGEHKVAGWTDSDAINAVWSPDGRKIAFVRRWTKPREKFITYVMNADGSGLRALDRTLRGDLALAWLPDGKHLLTVRALRFVIADAVAGGARDAGIPGLAGSPCVLPDGKRVALLVARRGGAEQAIFVGRIGGGPGSLVRITPWETIADKIDCSPDGSRIVFSAPHFGPPQSSNVYTIRVDGSGLRQLTHNRGGRINNGADSWSPDGIKLAFVSNRTGGVYQIYTANTDGTAVAQVTHDREAHLASWGSHP
jgi:TolB protein